MLLTKKLKCVFWWTCVQRKIGHVKNWNDTEAVVLCEQCKAEEIWPWVLVDGRSLSDYWCMLLLKVTTRQFTLTDELPFIDLLSPCSGRMRKACEEETCWASGEALSLCRLPWEHELTTWGYAGAWCHCLSKLYTIFHVFTLWGVNEGRV